MASNFKLKRIQDGKEFQLSEVSLLVGRSDSCAIQVLEGHPSREHARVVERDGAVLVQDLHSTNGTYVNNSRIDVSCVLKVGDVVKFGDEAFSVQSLTAPDATVLMRSLGSNDNVSASVIDEDDEDDQDSTSFLEVYALPPGWDSDTTFGETLGKLDEVKREAIDRYVEKISRSMQGNKGIFFIFFSDDNPPVFKSLVIKDEGGQRSWSFGRDESQNVVFDHACISKYHAKISYSDAVWIIEDNNSTNGITLGGRKHARVELSDGMLLEISNVEVLVRLTQ